jgi:hypothetical protein
MKVLLITKKKKVKWNGNISEWTQVDRPEPSGGTAGRGQGLGYPTK